MAKISRHLMKNLVTHIRLESCFDAKQRKIIADLQGFGGGIKRTFSESLTTFHSAEQPSESVDPRSSSSRRSSPSATAGENHAFQTIGENNVFQTNGESTEMI